jgi:hypothetical protein
MHVAWRHGARKALAGAPQPRARDIDFQGDDGFEWFCPRDVPPDRIRRLFGFVELARVAG